MYSKKSFIYANCLFLLVGLGFLVSSAIFKIEIPHLGMSANNHYIEAMKQMHTTVGSQGKAVQVMEHLEVAANQGHVGAQKQLAKMYQYGIGIQINKSVAQTWWKAAAAAGDLQAQFEVGRSLLQITDEEEQLKALELLKKAAIKNHPEAQLLLAKLYMENTDWVKHDMDLAIYWLQTAAFQGNGEAQFMLGHAYQTGHGVKKDLQQAVIFYEQAKNSGQASAVEVLKELSLNVKNVSLGS